MGKVIDRSNRSNWLSQTLQTEHLKFWRAFVPPEGAEKLGTLWSKEDYLSGVRCTNLSNCFCIIEVDGQPVSYVRDTNFSPNKSDFPFLLIMQRSGSAVYRLPYCEVMHNPRQLLFLDSLDIRSVDIREAYSHCIVQIPRARMLEFLDDPRARSGTTVSVDSPLGYVTANFVTSLITQLAHLIPDQANHLLAQLADLTALMLNSVDRYPKPPPRASLKSLRVEQIANYIEERIKDPNLSPASIAEAHGISVRMLYKTFQDYDLSVSKYIMNKRLESCADDLIDPQFKELSLTEIAFRWGFKSHSHFTRSFKAHFHKSPSEYRQSRGNNE